ncbi:MAG TPA: M14 family metallopeptidase, partial [Bdellovibrionales bacterium]|nr:M14 family metallopeptidase [Bdellovibrionales bacterium]
MITDLPGPKEVGEWRVPSRTDDDLFVDWTYLPATLSPERLIVLSSGVHGLETYAGSAIQTMFLKELWPSINRSQTGFLIVHALNPWGFKHHRRSTENHVNLNRNCSAGTEMYRLKNPRGAELTKRFVPEEPLRPGPSRLARAFRWREGKPFFDDIPMDELIRAICLGQFEDPKGLEFGGFEAEPQIQFLTLKLKSVMPYCRDVILLDLHTGLGGR